MTVEISDDTIAQANNVVNKLEQAMLDKLDGGDAREVMTGLVELRMWNRAAQDAVKQVKEATFQSNQQVDGCKLDIQNIAYEHKHLRSEIEQCREYESRHEQLKMISREEYLEEHPDDEQLSEYDLMIARIKDEESKRLDLFLEKQKVVKEREGLYAQVKSLRDDYENLDLVGQHFDKIIEATTPLQSYFDKHREDNAEDQPDLNHSQD